MIKHTNQLLRYTVLSVLFAALCISSIMYLRQIDVFSVSTPPYIATTDSERASIPTPVSKIYLESGAKATNVPAATAIQKIINLKAAMTSYKQGFVSEMGSYEDTYVNSNTLIETNVNTVDINNTLLDGYRNNIGVVTAVSQTDLTNKINAATGSITIRIANLSTNKNLTFGSATKSVTLIVDNLSFESSNRTLTVYGNLIILNTLQPKNNFIVTKKTNAQTDGNFMIDAVGSVDTNSYFTVAGTFFVSEDLTLNTPTKIIADNFITGKSVTFSGYNSTFDITNTTYINENLIVTQLLTMDSKDFIVNGFVRNSAYNTDFNISNMFYVNHQVELNERTLITTTDFVVTESLTSTIYGSSIDAANLVYIFDDLKIDQLTSISAANLIVDGNVTSAVYGTSLAADDLIYVQNDFTIKDRTNISANRLFVGGNLTSSIWGQAFTITKDIFLGNADLLNQTTFNAANGDLIIEGELSIATEIIVSVGGRVAVGGNITYSGYTFTLNAGGRTTSVIVGTGEATPMPTTMPTPTPTESPVVNEDLLIRETVITPSASDGIYLLTITYKRLVGITEEQIIIKDMAENVIQTFTIDPAREGVADGDGYVTFDNLEFYAATDTVSITVKGTTRIVTYSGGGYHGNNGKPYFTTVEAERVRVPSPISTIYMDHSGNKTASGSIVRVGVKFLRKAISDYGKYFKTTRATKLAAFDSAASRYNDKTTEQLEAIIASTPGSNIVIATDNLNLTKDIRLGSSSKSVTLIVDNLTVNSPRNIEVFGNLIVKNNFNANQAVVIKTNKVYGAGGDFFTGNVNYNGKSTLTIAGTLYANSLTLQQGGTITADSIVIGSNLIVNATSQITAANDIFAGSVLCNQAANITATYGDFVVYRDLTANSTFTLTVGGRVSVGKRVLFNSTAAVWAGGQKTALMLVDDTQESEVVVVVSDTFSKPVKVDIKGAVYPAPMNHVASFNNKQTYFAGDAVFYKVELPANAKNMVLNISLNQSGISLFEVLPGTSVYAMGISADGSTGVALQTNASAGNLKIGPIAVADEAAAYIFKVKLKRAPSSSEKVNVISNTALLQYTNTDATRITVKKNFNITIVSSPGLRLN